MLPPLAIKEVEDPAQIIVVPEMLIVGAALIVTNCDALEVQPFAVPVTVYVVLETGETL